LTPAPAHRRQPKVPFVAVLLVLLLIAGVAYLATSGGGAPGGSSAAGHPSSPRASGSSSGSPAASPTPSPQVDAAGVTTPGPIDPAHPGLRTFRGNYSRDYYGEGPVPNHPVIRWRFPQTGGLCGVSTDIFSTRTWCGTGWTGQPNVIPMGGGKVEVREGAYDWRYHFLDGATGQPTRPAFKTQDLAKGSATSDSNGYPLYYGGSRDNRLRVIAMDGSRPHVLWQFNSNTQKGKLWNDDWDAAPLQVGDYLLEGGENSWFYVIRLNRGYDAAGDVTVDPKIVMRVPGWDPKFRHQVRDADISIENSVAFRDGVAYFSNSGGLVQGWDISDILNGGTTYKRVFRFWDGDDTDATIVIDPAGDLIVGRKMEENVPRPESFPRDHQIGSLMKLDPSNPTDPVVWSVQVGGFAPDGGILGTPALYDGVVYATYTEGGVVAVDETTGKLLWNLPLPGPTWSSPVPIDGKLIVGDGAGYLNCFQLNPNHTSEPRLLWHLHVGGIIESTPAVWHGWIYVGSRDGGIYGIADPNR
jgi:hypothetical protein